MKKQAGPIDAVVDKINSLGQQAHNLAKKVPGLDWAAELGEMSLSDNKYLRAAQIIGTVTGGATAPIGVMILLKKILAGGPSGEEALAKVMDLTRGMERKIQQANQIGQRVERHMAASFPAVKNPVLRARLIRVAMSVQLLEAARKIAGDDLALIAPDEPEEDEDSDIVAPDSPEEDTAEDEEAIAPLAGLALRTLAPAALSGLMNSGGGDGGGGAGGEPTDMQASITPPLVMVDPEEEAMLDDDEEDQEATVLKHGTNVLEDVGNMVAPRTTENISDMLGSGSSWDEDEDEDEEACGDMDDGSYPAGPRNDANNSRYKVKPSHDQSTVDLLRFTAGVDSIISRLEKAANG